MRKSSKLLFAGLTAAMLLALAVGTASAGHLSVNEQRFDAKWSNLEFEAAGNTIRCPVTLEGSFHSATIAKVTGALIGHITRAAVANASCSGGHATVLAETLPWPILYNGFTGTLPNITRINVNLIRASFQIQPTGSITCLARTETAHPARGIIELSSGTATTLAADRTAEIPLTGSGGLCSFGGEGHFSGTTTTLARLGTTTQIRVTLI